MNLLFVCSRNQWRSPTAEKMWSKHPSYSTRSAGTSPNAKRPISINDIHWADLIFVMEKKHKNRVIASFPRAAQFKKIHVLDIPDEYQFDDPELKTELSARVHVILDTL